jgi:hypothetical protein
MSKQCVCSSADSCSSCGKIFEYNNFPKFCSIECAIKCFQPIDKVDSELDANKRDYSPYQCNGCKISYHRREYYYNMDFCSIGCLLQIIKPQIYNQPNKTNLIKHPGKSNTLSTIFIIFSAIGLTSVAILYHKQLSDIMGMIKKLKD